MRIAVDATSWHNRRGYGRHARSLLKALVPLDTSNQYTLFFDAPAEPTSIPQGSQVRQVESRSPAALAAASDGHRSARDMWRMSRALSDPGYDALLFPTVYSYVPVFSQAKKLLVIHDVIVEKYPELTLPRRLPRLFWNAKVAMGRRQADAIITVSEYSKRAIVEHFKIPADRVYVAGEASDPVFRVLPDPQIPSQLQESGIQENQRLICYIGGFGPHKNLERLVIAFSRIAARQEFADLRLVMVGKYDKEVFHSYVGKIRTQIEALGLSPKVHFTGYLSDEDLVSLLNCCTVVALPSLMEGFGLPAIEAAACGCPVVATCESPLPALLGEGGLYVDPLDGAALESALICVLSDPDLQAHMRHTGLAAAGRLTWESAAHQMQCIIQEVVQS
jgi:glycosyltransferase involved in cell wall biosynthesis